MLLVFGFLQLLKFKLGSATHDFVNTKNFVDNSFFETQLEDIAYISHYFIGSHKHSSPLNFNNKGSYPNFDSNRPIRANSFHKYVRAKRAMYIQFCK